MFPPAPERVHAGALRLPLTRRLTLGERARLAVEILSAYAAARSALSHEPIERALARLRAASAPPDPRSGAVAESRRLGAAVARMLRWLPGDTRCLVRSLVLTRVLAHRGIPSTFVIGTRSTPEFLAHAWVEHAGQPVLDPGDGSFARLVEL
jgi:Transglutaminase-like superfamily